jgi:hypothetical protein
MEKRYRCFCEHYRKTGTRKGCPDKGCEINRNIAELTPTITATKMAECLKVSKVTTANLCKARGHTIKGMYKSGGWQIPRRLVTEKPFSELTNEKGPHK